MGPFSIGVEVQRITDVDTPSIQYTYICADYIGCLMATFWERAAPQVKCTSICNFKCFPFWFAR